VARQGGFQVEPGTGVLQLLANAGGLTELAHKDRIFVLRRDPNPVRIRFSFDLLSRLDNRASSFRIQTGDVVVVESEGPQTRSRSAPGGGMDSLACARVAEDDPALRRM